jgi:Tol biopolymer transport system component
MKRKGTLFLLFILALLMLFEDWTIGEFHIEPSRVVLARTITLRPLLTEGYITGEPILSPQGDRVAWFHSTTVSPRWWTTWKRLLSGVASKPQEITTLFVMRLKGSEVREIGTINGSWNRNDLQWRPDGKALSFVHDGNLYTVVVD